MEEIRFTTEMEGNRWTWETLAEEKQNVYQFDNYSATLYRDPESGKIYYYEDRMNDYYFYELESEDLPEDGDYEKLLAQFIGEWVSNEDDPKLEMYCWGRSNPAEDAVDEDFVGNCKVLVVGCYAGYQPIHWAADNNIDPLDFGSAREAQAWIDDRDNGVYYLSNNEQGRPSYYIIAD